MCLSSFLLIFLLSYVLIFSSESLPRSVALSQVTSQTAGG